METSISKRHIDPRFTSANVIRARALDLVDKCYLGTDEQYIEAIKLAMDATRETHLYAPFDIKKDYARELLRLARRYDNAVAASAI